MTHSGSYTMVVGWHVTSRMMNIPNFMQRFPDETSCVSCLKEQRENPVLSASIVAVRNIAGIPIGCPSEPKQGRPSRTAGHPTMQVIPDLRQEIMYAPTVRMTIRGQKSFSLP